MNVESFKLLKQEEYDKIINENKLLKEEIKALKDDITRAYYTMISLDKINEEEIEEI